MPTTPENGSDQQIGLVPVMEIADAALLPIVKSVLAGAGITYVVQGEAGMGLLPLGQFAKGMIRRAFSCVVHVSRADLETAKELLRDLT